MINDLGNDSRYVDTPVYCTYLVARLGISNGHSSQYCLIGDNKSDMGSLSFAYKVG